MFIILQSKRTFIIIIINNIIIIMLDCKMMYILLIIEQTTGMPEIHVGAVSYMNKLLYFKFIFIIFLLLCSYLNKYCELLFSSDYIQ